MKVEFIKNFKGYKSGDIVKISKKDAKKLIDCGFAVPAKTYTIGNLVIAPIIKPQKEQFRHSTGPVQHVGIFVKTTYGLFDERAVYTHILTENDFLTNDTITYEFEPDGDMVVDELFIKPLTDVFFIKMMEKGWTAQTKIGVNTIRLLENELNGKTDKKELTETEKKLDEYEKSYHGTLVPFDMEK